MCTGSIVIYYRHTLPHDLVLLIELKFVTVSTVLAHCHHLSLLKLPEDHTPNAISITELNSALQKKPQCGFIIVHRHTYHHHCRHIIIIVVVVVIISSSNNTITTINMLLSSLSGDFVLIYAGLSPSRVALTAMASMRKLTLPMV